VLGLVSLVSAQPDTLWTSIWESALDEKFMSVDEAADGGFICCGDQRIGDSDAYVVKLDADGNYEWSKYFSGESDKRANDIKQVSDGNYILTGYEKSLNNETDLLLMKLHSSGNVLWEKTYGFPTTDESGNAIEETSDGGFIITGKGSSGTSSRMSIIKTDDAGNVEFQALFTSGAEAQGKDIIEVEDGYVAVGWTRSGSGDNDVYLLKCDYFLNEVWARLFGGDDGDEGSGLARTIDGGFVVVGSQYVTGPYSYQMYIVKTNDAGIEEWNLLHGGIGSDGLHSVDMTMDGDIITTGFTYESGKSDIKLMRISSSGSIDWEVDYGGAEYESGYCITTLLDGGYALAGNTNSFGYGGYDAWLLRFESEMGLPVVLFMNPYQSLAPMGCTLDFGITYSNLSQTTQHAIVNLEAYLPGETEPAWQVYNPAFEFPPGDMTKQYTLAIPYTIPIAPGYLFVSQILDLDLEVVSEDTFEFEVLEAMTTVP